MQIALRVLRQRNVHAVGEDVRIHEDRGRLFAGAGAGDRDPVPLTIGWSGLDTRRGLTGAPGVAVVAFREGEDERARTRARERARATGREWRGRGRDPARGLGSGTSSSGFFVGAHGPWRSCGASEPGWGHTPIEHAVDVAKRNQIKRLALFHHDVQRTDDELEDFASVYAQPSTGNQMEVFFAREGMTIDL